MCVRDERARAATEFREPLVNRRIAELVIGDVTEIAALPSHPVGERAAGMRQALDFDLESTHFERLGMNEMHGRRVG